ncbi:restriction endonuclease subunit S [Pseudomonas aeruginosa]|uniref:restriction endonuclease subunit S n=1 Tax=Pseudomonas aeruginosa TaxID=287 RepID=UPI004062B38A
MKNVPLGDIATLVRGVSFSKEEGSLLPLEGHLPVIRAGSIQASLLLREGQIWVPSDKIKSTQKIRIDDIVMCTSSGSSDLVGKCARSTEDFDGSFGAFCVGIRADQEKASPSYLYHFLCSPVFKNWTSASSGANIKNIRVSELAEFQVPLPPLPEQKHIAAILDKADAIRRKRQQAIQLADDFLRAVFLDMFGDPVTNPKGWDVKRIEEVAAKDKYAIKAGPFGSALKKEDYVPEGYKIYGQEQVIRDDLEYGDYFINEEKYESLASCSVSEGDVLISLVGSFGKVSVVPKDYHPGIINPRLMKIRFNESCASPWYMKYLLTTKEMIRKIEGMSHGGTMGILNVGKIRDLEVINPPLNLQESFLKISTQVRSIKARCELVAAHPLFDSLSQKAFSGQL